MFIGLSLSITGQLRSSASAYAIVGLDPAFVTDFGAEFYRKSGATSTFSDSITHSASSNATMVDSDGLLKWRPHNLVRYSEQFDNAAWKLGNSSTRTPDADVAPDGTLTAERVQFPVSGGTFIGQDVTLTAGVTYTFSVYVKATLGTSSFDLYHLEAATSITSGATKTATTEWQRFEFSFTQTTTVTTGTSGTVGVNNGDDSYASDILLWGAHLYRSDLGGMVNNPDRGDSYVPTTTSAVYLPRRGHHVYNGDSWVNKGLLHESEQRVNLVPYSNDFTQWTNSGSVDSVASGVASPDGTQNTTEIVEDTSTAPHAAYLVFGAASANWTASFYIKQKTSGRYAQFKPFGLGTGVAWATFNPLDGSLYESGGTNLVTTTSEAVGNGWYRVSFTCSSALLAGDGIQVILTDGTTGESPSYTGDGTSGIYIYGAQLEAGSTPSSYIPNAGATSGVTREAETLTVPAANLPRPSPVVIGEELVTGDSSTFTSSLGDWTYYTGATASAVDGKFSIGGIGTYRIVGLLTVGKPYLVQFDWTRTNTSSVPYVGDRLGSSTQIRVPTGGALSGTATGVIVCGNSDAVVGSASGAVTIDNISVKEINPLSVSIQMQGEMTYANTGSSTDAIMYNWSSTTSGFPSSSYYIFAFLRTDSTFTGRLDFRQRDDLSGVDVVTTDGNYYSPGVNVPFNIASRHGSTFINGAVDGVALTADLTPVALPDLSATDLQLGYDFMGTISLFRIWADDLTDAGIADASAPSTVPSLSLTFDGASTSFTDTGMTV